MCNIHLLTVKLCLTTKPYVNTKWFSYFQKCWSFVSNFLLSLSLYGSLLLIFMKKSSLLWIISQIHLLKKKLVSLETSVNDEKGYIENVSVDLDFNPGKDDK